MLYKHSGHVSHMKPVKYENGLPVFLTSQLDDYGFPEDWGYDQYEVVETRDTVTMTTDFKLEQSYDKRTIHRYYGSDRFNMVLGQLLGDRGTVPDHIVSLVKAYYKEGEWDGVRKILKHYKLRLYYNRIPYILQQITKLNSVGKVTAIQYQKIQYNYRWFCIWYEQHKSKFQRLYFPSMRFIALKCMELADVPLNYEIPLARTERKYKQLMVLWNAFLVHYELDSLL